MDEYLVPSGFGEAELSDRKSRFIGHIWRTDTEEEALSLIKKMREQYWDARHNVYAYIIQGGATRYSDDSEPQGTAGMPILDVLRREGVFNVTCVVTRYFGGILLGTGGLVRAYSGAAKLALDAAGLSMLRLWDQLRLDCPYRLYEQITGEVARFSGVIEDAQFGAEVTLRMLLPQEQTAAFCARLTDLSGGQLKPEQEGQISRAVPTKCS